DSAAEIQLECGSAVRLAPQSVLSFSNLRLRDDGVASTVVSPESGTVFFNIRKADARDFHVALPRGQLATSGKEAKFRIDLSADGSTSVEVSDGRVQLNTDGVPREELKKS